MTSISVVIPVLNDAIMLQACLDALAAQTRPTMTPVTNRKWPFRPVEEVWVIRVRVGKNAIRIQSTVSSQPCSTDILDEETLTTPAFNALAVLLIDGVDTLDGGLVSTAAIGSLVMAVVNPGLVARRPLPLPRCSG
ncbi:MAG: hypothetical protein KF739_01010 [Cryobacterium sp.]|nr:hypothetical protein [Micrococcales bacterium]MBX3308997.1 hypothetical protein [Cryobacterium sp.]